MVCDPCNSQFLSGIEDRAKPYVLPMIQGYDVELTPVQQQIVATWVYKLALIWDMSQTWDDPSQGNVFNPGDPLWFRHHAKPAPNTHVYIGGVRPQDSSFSRVWRAWSPFPVVSPEGLARATTGFSVTFNVRHLAAQVLGHDFREELAFKHTGEGHGSLRRIWPVTPETITWPPPLVFDETMLEALSRITPGHGTHIPPPDPSQYGRSQ